MWMNLSAATARVMVTQTKHEQRSQPYNTLFLDLEFIVNMC